MLARRLLATLRGNRRRAGRALETGGRRGRSARGRTGAAAGVRRGADHLGALQGPGDPGFVERPRLALAQRTREDGRHGEELRFPFLRRTTQVGVEPRHREPNPRRLAGGGVFEQLRRDTDQALQHVQRRIVLGADLPPILEGERHARRVDLAQQHVALDRKSTRLNSSHLVISYAVFCLKKKKTTYKDALTKPLQMDLSSCVQPAE